MVSPRLVVGAVACVSLVAVACAPAAGPAISPTQPAPSTSPAPVSSPVAGGPAASPSVGAAPSPVASLSPIAVPSPSAAVAPGGPVTNLTVGFSERIAAVLPLWYGYEMGIFKAHNLNLDVQFISSGTSISSVLAGQVQVANGGGAEALSAVSNGADLKDVGSTDAVYPFVFEAVPAVQSPDDLKGKKVGVSNPGSASDVATRAALMQMGLQPDTDVSIIAVGSLQNRTAALLGGAIQAGVAQPPDTLTLEAQGMHSIYDLAQQKLPSSQESIVVQSSYLQSHRDVLQAYLDATAEAIVKEKADKPGSLQVLQKYLQNDDQQALSAAYDFFINEVIPSNPVPSAEQFTYDVQILSAQNPQVKNVDLNTFIDPSLAQSSVDRGLSG